MNHPRYTRTAMGLHWLMALLIFAGFGLGLTMVEMGFSPQKLKFYSWHKWIGITIFTLVAFRLYWRLTHPAPALPSSMPGWQQQIAQVSHVLMYVLFFAIPLSGWLFSSSKGIQTVYLGVIPLPDLLTKDMGEIVLAATDPEKPFVLSDLIRLVHKSLNYLLGALVMMHIAAALKHYFIDRDDILGRMIPALKPRS
jgi:cytochrome b561